MDRSDRARRQQRLRCRLPRDAARDDCETTRASVERGRNSRRLGNALPWVCPLATRSHLGLRRCAPSSKSGAGSMIVVLLNTYLLILFLLVKMKIVPFNLFWKVSPLLVFLLLLVGLFIPM